MTPEQKRAELARFAPMLPKRAEDVGSILDCPNETGTWLAENMAEPIQTRAIEIIGDFLAGPRDQYANTRLLREVMQLAGVCEDAIHNREDA
jgi:hypothetical protein